MPFSFNLLSFNLIKWISVLDYPATDTNTTDIMRYCSFCLMRLFSFSLSCGHFTDFRATVRIVDGGQRTSGTAAVGRIESAAQDRELDEEKCIMHCVCAPLGMTRHA